MKVGFVGFGENIVYFRPYGVNPKLEICYCQRKTFMGSSRKGLSGLSFVNPRSVCVKFSSGQAERLSAHLHFDKQSSNRLR